MQVLIVPLLEEAWGDVARIFQEGIDTGDATFEETVPSWDTWDRDHLQTCRLVALSAGMVVGWAALSPVSERCIYGGVAEVSVYVTKSEQGKGVGKALLQHLIVESELVGLWTLQAGIFPENTASLALHLACGFRKVGYRERIGRLNGMWRDVILLERRSENVGIHY